MSNTLEVGPIKIMKRPIDLASQAFGAFKYSGSTLSLLLIAHVSSPTRNRKGTRPFWTHQGIEA
jgi:hypothetical protein